MKRVLINQTFPTFEPMLKQELFRVGTMKIFKKGELVVRMGRPLIQTFIVLQGSLKVVRESPNGSEFVVAYLQAGNSFGVSLSSDTPAENKISLVTFESLEPTYILQIAFEDKDLLAKQFDSWYKYILRTSVLYYGFFLNVIDNIAFQKLDFRVEIFIIGLRRMHATNNLKVSHQEIASSLNTSREAISRQLKKMEKKGKVKLRHGEIEIVNL